MYQTFITHMWYVLKHIRSHFMIFSLFTWFWIFTYTKLKHKSKIETKTTHKKNCKMHKMHEDITFNAWRVLQRSKELDQWPKERKLNHRNPYSSKQNDCLEWVSHESEMRVGRMRTRDAYRQEVKSIEHFL